MNICITAIPKIKTSDLNLETDAGKPFTMTLPYDAYPRAEAEWFKEDSTTSEYVSLPDQNIDTTADKTSYRLFDPRRYDKGRYKVVIQNKHGKGEGYINLNVIGRYFFCYYSVYRWV